MSEKVENQRDRKPEIAAISLVIPTLNRHARLRALLLKLSAQRTLPQDLVVIEQGSRQSLEESFVPLADRGVRCRYVFSQFKSAAFARNIGLILADSPAVIFLDDDVEPITDFVSAFLSDLSAHPEIVCAAGHVICEHPVPQVAAENTFEPQDEFVSFGLSGNVAFRVDSLLNFGGFNPLIPCHGEETELFIRMDRAKMKIFNSRASSVLHLLEQSGGTRDTKFKSQKWYLDFIRSNSTRIVRVHSILFLLPWILKNRRFMQEALRAGLPGQARLTPIISAILDGARLGQISRTVDTIALTCALMNSSICEPFELLSSKDRHRVIMEAKRLTTIRGSFEYLQHFRTLVPIDFDTSPVAIETVRGFN
jgi:GT2 family glycosyltransferase